MDPNLILLLVVAVPLAFFVSASAGLGGSLLMVPTMMLAFGTKEGVAMAALLLAANNVAKVAAYRRDIPWRDATAVVALTFVGVGVGAVLLVAAPERAVVLGVAAALIFTLIGEQVDLPGRKAWGGALALGAGVTSGFSGTSGPLKGLALRSLNLDRRHLVGAASIVSLVGDATKAAVFSQAGLLSPSHLVLVVGLVPVMIGATLLGRRFNDVVGERGYAVLFWVVMAGYLSRLLVWG